MKMNALKHEFMEFIPDDLRDGTIYVSMRFATAIHKCCCGCGQQVVTPFSPTDWKLTFDGETISLYPSIGNWNFPCQSHYWIKRSKVVWDRKWSRREIDEARVQDRMLEEEYFETTTSEVPGGVAQAKSQPTLWKKLKKFLR